jgi:hypothetical protein
MEALVKFHFYCRHGVEACHLSIPAMILHIQQISFHVHGYGSMKFIDYTVIDYDGNKDFDF